MTETRLCEHLQPMLDFLMSTGAKMSFAGQAWSKNCRTWVYLDRTLDTAALSRKFKLASCVRVHSHRGTHERSEYGFYCEEHQDGLMGPYPV